MGGGGGRLHCRWVSNAPTSPTQKIHYKTTPRNQAWRCSGFGDKVGEKPVSLPLHRRPGLAAGACSRGWGGGGGQAPMHLPTSLRLCQTDREPCRGTGGRLPQMERSQVPKEGMDSPRPGPPVPRSLGTHTCPSTGPGFSRNSPSMEQAGRVKRTQDTTRDPREILATVLGVKKASPRPGVQDNTFRRPSGPCMRKHALRGHAEVTPLSFLEGSTRF